MKTREFKVGDKVFDARFGWGEVTSEDYLLDYPIKVIFKGGREDAYTKQGVSFIGHNPILSHTEYSIHSTPSEFPKVMEVSDDGKEWYKRVVIAKAMNGVVAWDDAEKLEDVDVRFYGANYWKYYREI